MKAILVKYLPATNTKGDRLKASAEQCKPLTVSRDYEFGVERQSKALAAVYCELLGWDHKRLYGGQLPNGDYCFVMGVKHGAN